MSPRGIIYSEVTWSDKGREGGQKIGNLGWRHLWMVPNEKSPFLGLDQPPVLSIALRRVVFKYTYLLTFCNSRRNSTPTRTLLKSWPDSCTRFRIIINEVIIQGVQRVWRGANNHNEKWLRLPATKNVDKFLNRLKCPDLLDLRFHITYNCSTWIFWRDGLS